MAWIKCVFLMMLASNSYCERPAVRVRITQKGLAYAMESAARYTKEQLITRSLPDINGQLSKYLSYNYSLTKMNITKMKISSTNLRSYPKHGLFATIRDVDFDLTGSWKLQGTWMNFVGDFSVQVEKMSIKLITAMGATSGRLTVTKATCASKVDGFNIDVTGPDSWIFQFLKGYINGFLKTRLPQNACEQAKARIKSFLNKKFSEFPVKQNLEKYVTLDYSIVKDPGFQPGYVDLFLKGEFQPQNGHMLWDNKPRVQPIDFRRSRMMYVTILDHMVNSAGEAFYKQGMLNVEVSANQISKKHRNFFSWNTLKDIPTVYGFNIFKIACRNCGMKVQMEATSAPKIVTDRSGINISVKGIARITTDLPNKSNKTLVTLAMNVTATATPKLDGTKLATQISNLKITMKIIEPTAGLPTSVNLEVIKGLVRKEIDDIIQKRLSAFEIPLPVSDQLQLTTPKITYGKHFITLETDIRYI